MKLNRYWVVFFLASKLVMANQTCVPAQEKTIIYQPWASHLNLTKPQLNTITKTLNQFGFKHVILQWHRYGNQDYSQADIGYWVHKMTNKKRPFIEGLYADPNFFQALNLSDPELENYLITLRKNSLDDANQLSLNASRRILGWYLPEEIDDLNWRTEARQNILSNHFKLMTQALNKLHPGAPVYASTFFGGHARPQAYANMLNKIYRETGIIWIIQDGQGVLRKPQPNTTQYLKAVSRTLPPNAWLGLLENFTELDQTSENRFCPASNTEIKARKALWCKATGREPEIYFSLNQLNNELLGHKNSKCKTRIGNVVTD